MEKNLKIGIVGAGIQGISNALFLQKKGFSVTIFDRDEPGSPAASYGNAGHFSPYASVPINRPDVLTDVPAMLLSSTGPLALKWNYVPKMMPWFLQFVRNCTTKRMMHTAKNMHQILDLALPAYDELFDEVELGGLVEKKGILYIWNDQSLKSRELEIKVRNELGVDQQVITPKEIHDLEPNIKPIYHGGVYYQYGRHARNPKKILLKLYDLFLKKGGKFLKMNIKDINFNDEKPVIKFGLGEKVLNETFSIEKKGLIPDTKWKKNNLGKGWVIGETLNLIMRIFAVFLFLKKQILMQLQNHLCLVPLFLIFR
ncbi:FAD-binding oxidoreductase [Candidatus Pelagibacter ubique]|nr:FAD-binding oxidoreductase [Candidatus Pelagibacter ubique]